MHGGATQQWGIASDRPLPLMPSIAQLLDVRCRSVEQMRMVNALCRLVEFAEDHG